MPERRAGAPCGRCRGGRVRHNAAPAAHFHATMARGGIRARPVVLLTFVILIERQREATRPMARVGAARSAGGDRPGGSRARTGEVWGTATDGFDRWVAGDLTGLDDLVAAMTPVLWHVVRAYRLSESATEDVLQTTWLALVRRRASILDATAVGGWLTTTARREAWRVAGADASATPVEDDALAPHLPRQRSAEEAVVQRDEGDRLWAAV